MVLKLAAPAGLLRVGAGLGGAGLPVDLELPVHGRDALAWAAASAQPLLLEPAGPGGLPLAVPGRPREAGHGRSAENNTGA